MAVARLSSALKQRLLGGQDGGEVGDPFPVLDDRQVQRPLGGLGALSAENLACSWVLQEGDQVILHLLLGAEDGVLIGDEQLLETGVLEPDDGW